MTLGSLASGALSGNTLTLQASFSLTTKAPGQGFFADVILGDPPTTAATSASPQQFAHAMAGLGADIGAAVFLTPAQLTMNPLSLAPVGHPQAV